MDGFPPMPVEIARLIAIEIVRARGIKRALRLRRVNRSWDHGIVEAIVESGILEENPKKKAHWTLLKAKYVMHKLQQREDLLSRGLRIVRKAAQRLVALRTGKPESETQEEVQKVLWEFCKATQDFCGVTDDSYFEVPKEIEPIDDSDEAFRGAMVAGAVALKDLHLLRQVLPLVEDQDSEHLIYMQTDMKDWVLGWPLDIAAYRGHTEALRMLFEVLKHRLGFINAYMTALEYASAASQIKTVKLSLYPLGDSTCDYPYEYFLSEMKNKTPEVFDCLYEWRKDNLLKSHYNPWEIRDIEHARSELRSQAYCWSTSYGNLPMMKYLVNHGVPAKLDSRLPDDGDTYHTWMSVVADGGYDDVMEFLLENGQEISSQSLEYACRHGSPACVRILLEHGAKDTLKPGNALLEAVKGEHEQVLRLLESDGSVSEGHRKRALEFAEKEGLESMVQLIKEYM
ncbi:multiple ankyrin repeats single KH domain [Colletotrichum truncatum]|uniref:Multiple ankyrin repeats single KH domain n=1 Tax=Colletotrichum truncatum TaxID=5467 RepID=A0ACC3YNI1_COLTU|nr:multiple ankyrin repeats single KH domain [Colletotrichum truncatum]KAF6789446.1 multiple ankyrin repeats single KH domain [Colletotrichum truncatum]